MAVKLIVLGQCGVISLLLLACPLYIPEKVQVKAEPAVSLPLGTPDSLQDNLDLSINGLADVKLDTGEGQEVGIYDFQGEYGDIRAFIIKISLIKDLDLGEFLPDVPSLPDATLPDTGTLPEGTEGITPPPVEVPEIPSTDIEIDFGNNENLTSFLKGTQPNPGVDLKPILDILNKYQGLQFRSIPIYFYIQGPARIFKNDNVTIKLTALPLPGTELFPEGTVVSPCDLPIFPSPGAAMTGKLSPKSKTSSDLEGVLNKENPPEKLVFDYDIGIGPITVKSDELSELKKEFDTPLSATMVVVLPLMFRASQEIPILSEKNKDEDAKAIHLLEEGKDMFGRSSGEESDSAMNELLDRMQSLVIRTNIENNLGLSGFAPVYSKKPPSSDLPEDGEDGAGKRLGEIKLSGPSSISISKKDFTYPFNIWLEMYLGAGQEFAIKRPAEDSNALPLKLSLTVTVKTRINETF
jgi:hypothetical protein